MGWNLSFWFLMARKNKRLAFDESDSDNDGDGNEFQKYLKEKSAQSSKRARSSEAVEAASLGSDSVTTEREPEAQEASSTVLEGLLKSKKQREQDKLHIQSVKNKLERELDKPSGAEDLVFTTAGYKAKREEYDRADLLAEDEQKQEGTANQLGELTGSSRSVALRLLMTKNAAQEPPNAYRPESGVSTHRTSRQTEIGNDVYRSPRSISTRPDVIHGEDTMGLDREQKKLCIKEFLKSTKTAQEIDKCIENYKSRHNVPVN